MIVAIYGLGLIGGSIGRAALSKTEHKIYGADIDKSAVLKAKMLDAITDELTDETLRRADLVVFAVNPRTAIRLMYDVCPKLKKGATVIDCCGNKRNVVAAMDKLNAEYKDIGFIGTHPMAGREFSGVEHSTAKLFEKSFVIVTPVHSGINDFQKVRSFYTELGCDGITVATADEHDEMISYTSQLAHVLSSAYVKNPLSSKHAGFSAGSFKDLTRVARLNPKMWSELFIDNGDKLCPQIDYLIDRLKEYRDAIENKDCERLNALLQDGVDKKAVAEKAIKDKRKES